MRTIALLLAYYGGAGYGILNPLFGFLLFMHMLLLRPEYLVWGQQAFGRLYLVVFACTAVGYFLSRGRPSRSDIRWSDRPLLILGAFIAWTFVVSLVAEHSSDVSLHQAFQLSKTWFLAWLLSRLVIGISDIRKYVLVVTATGAMVGFWGILQGLAGNPRLDELGMGGSNYLAAQLVLIAPMCLAVAFDPRQTALRRIFWYALPALVIVTGSLYTGSRGGFIGMVVAFVFLGVTIGRRRYVYVMALVAIGAVLISSLVAERVFTRIESIFITDAKDLDTSAAARAALWKIGVLIWTRHPVAGVGLYNFSPAKDRLLAEGVITNIAEDVEEHIVDQPRFPHSMYFGLLAETGAVGVGLLIWLIARTLLTRVRARGSGDGTESLVLIARGAQAGLLGFSVAALFGDFQYIELLYAQVMLVGAVVAAMARISGSGRQDEPGAERPKNVYADNRPRFGPRGAR